MTEWLHFHFSLSCIGEGNGNPLQCSCLENPRDGGAWWAAVYGVTQSRTRLKRLAAAAATCIIKISWWGKKGVPHLHFWRSINVGGLRIRRDYWCVVAKLCPTLLQPRGLYRSTDTMEPPGSSVHGIFQVRILEWVAIFFSKGIFPIQRSNSHLLHWDVDSLPLSHRGSP